MRRLRIAVAIGILLLILLLPILRPWGGNGEAGSRPLPAPSSSAEPERGTVPTAAGGVEPGDAHGRRAEAEPGPGGTRSPAPEARRDEDPAPPGHPLARAISVLAGPDSGGLTLDSSALCLAFSADGALLAAGTGVMEVWSEGGYWRTKGEVVVVRTLDAAIVFRATPDGSSVSHIVFSPAGGVLYASTDSGAVYEVDLASGRVERKFDRFALGALRALGCSRDGSLIAAGSSAGEVVLLNPGDKTYRLLHRTKGGGVSALAFRRALPSRLVVATDGGDVEEVDAQSGERARVQVGGSDGSPSGCGISGAGTVFFGDTSGLHALEAPGFPRRKLAAVPVSRLAAAEDGNACAVTTHGSGAERVVLWLEGRLLDLGGSLNGDGISVVAVSEKARRVAAGGTWGSVRFYPYGESVLPSGRR